MSAEQIAENIFTGIEEVKKIFKNNPDQILALQTEINDIQHILGLYDHDAVALVKLAKELRNCLRKRWQLKDELRLLKPVYELLCKHEDFCEDLNRTKRDVDNLISVHEHREFSPRIRTDLEPSLLKKKNDLEKLKLVMEQRNAS